VFVVGFVVFSKERAARVFIVTLLAIGGIVVLDVKKGCLVYQRLSACRALVGCEIFLLHVGLPQRLGQTLAFCIARLYCCPECPGSREDNRPGSNSCLGAKWFGG
jgi:hypothetical protein